LTSQEVVVVKNLFLDQKTLKGPDPYASCESSLSSKRSSTAMNFHTLKTQRIADMTLRAKNPRLSLSIDPGTGFVGKVPGYQSIKNTYKEKVKPFFSPLPSDRNLQRIDSAASANKAPPMNWSKITDPNQSIRIVDSIENLRDDDFNDDEILFGTTKAGGMMHFKMRADAAILQ